MKAAQRIDRIEGSLTPKQAFLLWMREAHAHDSLAEYGRVLKGKPDSAYPLHRLADQMERSIKDVLKGRPNDEIYRATRRAVQDAWFLFFLHQQAHKMVLEDLRAWQLQRLLIASELKTLYREMMLSDALTWAWLRVSTELPYPLDPARYAAVEAAIEHHVVTWDGLDESEVVSNWIRDHLAGLGKTPLPEHAYLLQTGATASYFTPPDKGEVRRLFPSETTFKKFRAGKDYSYGLADVTDAEFERHYDGMVLEMQRLVHSGEVQGGTVVSLDRVPMLFLREAPLVDREWLDAYVVELSDWGTLMRAKGLRLSEPHDNSPFAWWRFISKTVDDATPEEAGKLRAQASSRVADFSGRTRNIGGRRYFHVDDYSKRRGGAVKSTGRASVAEGLVASSWNAWVARNGGPGQAMLGGIAVGLVRCWAAGYPRRYCDNGGTGAEVALREKLLRDLLFWSVHDVQAGDGPSADKSRSGEGAFNDRVAAGRRRLEGALAEVYVARDSLRVVAERYFDKRVPLFPDFAQAVEALISGLEGLADLYNRSLASEIERSRAAQSRPGRGSGKRASTVRELRIDSAEIRQGAGAQARERALYLIDMAKAEVLEAMGEKRRASEMAERHV